MTRQLDPFIFCDARYLDCAINWGAVGAIGTILAFFATAAAPIWHANRRQFAADRKVISLIAGACSYLQDGLDIVKDNRASQTGGAYVFLTVDSVEVTAEFIEGIDTLSLPDDRLIYPLLHLRDRLRRYLAGLKDALSNKQVLLIWERDIESEIEEIIAVHAEYELSYLFRAWVRITRRTRQRASLAVLVAREWLEARRKSKSESKSR